MQLFMVAVVDGTYLEAESLGVRIHIICSKYKVLSNAGVEGIHIARIAQIADQAPSHLIPDETLDVQTPQHRT